MSKLLVRPKAPDIDGCILKITPQSAGWKYVGFSVYKLAKGASLTRQEEGRETCIVILSGKLNFKSGEAVFSNIGERKNLFEGKSPYAVYVPQNTEYTLEAISESLEIALCTAPGGGDHEVRLIKPDAISTEMRGAGTNTRFVRNILPETEAAQSLLIAEVITPGGNWSSYPPHKHDSDNIPQESRLEETYYHRLNPSQGFAFQRVYTDSRDIDETLSVEDGDVVLVPKGYHPVGASHGYDLYYLNVMAGPNRVWIFKNDPAHEWMIAPQK